MTHRRVAILALLVVLAGLSVGCTPEPTLYRWGVYEQTLHEAYENPEAIPGFQAELLNLIQTSETDGGLLPPGIYAEYGYALYLNNQPDAAIIYFAKERERWPESAVLMTTVIKRLEERIADEEKGPDGEDVPAPPADETLSDDASSADPNQPDETPGPDAATGSAAGASGESEQ
ncbi:MAG: DUF4810 domain-containing protein [Deltaproteobacteria bacterium]|nr:DUF4810 domain-containing protein [Deltaproteobacteria bacterium]MBW2418899.1 DUF4810 domain-containing protein [Deltaproteobacteria bacterium]